MKMLDKLFIFGDSIMKGVMYNSEAGKYKLCESRDFDSISDMGIEVLNKSKMGATIDKGISILGKCGIPEKGSTVLLEYGGNDCDFDWKKISENPESSEFEPNVSMDEFSRKYREMIRCAGSRGAEVIVCNLIPIDAAKYMNWISRGLNRENILKWLGDTSMLSRWQEHYNEIACEAASKENCKIIDVRTPFLISHRFCDLLCEDGIHPTQDGHNLIEATMKSRLCLA